MIKKHPNDKITIFDVAEHAGVSKSTVSLVLTHSDKVSDKSKAKVERAIAELGYVYNRDAASLRSRRSRLVALVINDLTNPYSAQLAVGLEQYIYDLGLVPMLVNTGESFARQQQVVNTLKEYNVAAFVMCPAPATDKQWQNELIQSGFPVINIMREISLSSAPCILPDNRKGTFLAAEHLLSQAVQELAFIGGNIDISDYHERLAGFEQALSEHPSAVHSHIINSATTRQGGHQAFQKLRRQAPSVQAVVCFSDVIAYGFIEAMREVGLTPGKDIKVVGFDDLDDSALMTPALSSVRIDAAEIGRRTTAVLKEIMAGNKAPVRTLIDVELQVRESSL